MKGVVPYFIVDDAFATAELYRDVLDFTFDELFGDPPSFTIVARDDVRIMSRQVRPASAGVAWPNRSVMDEAFDAYVYVSNVDELATALRTKQADIVDGPVIISRVCGMRELLVRDCNGSVLAFGQG